MRAIITVSVFLLTLTQGLLEAVSEKPNIVLILADDKGEPLLLGKPPSKP